MSLTLPGNVDYSHDFRFPRFYSSMRHQFAENMAFTLRGMMHPIIVDHQARLSGSKVELRKARKARVVCCRTRISLDDPLYGDIGMPHFRSEIEITPVVEVSDTLLLAPMMGQLVIRDQHDENDVFGTISARRLASDYYRFSRRHRIASPTDLLDELVLTPLAAL